MTQRLKSASWLTSVDFWLILAVMGATVYSVGSMLSEAGDAWGALRSVALAGAVVRFGYVLQSRPVGSKSWWTLFGGFVFVLAASTFYTWLFFCLALPDKWLTMTGISRSWLALALAFGTEAAAFWLAFLSHVAAPKADRQKAETGNDMTVTVTDSRRVAVKGQLTKAQFLTMPDATNMDWQDIVQRAGTSERTARRWLAEAKAEVNRGKK